MAFSILAFFSRFQDALAFFLGFFSSDLKIAVSISVFFSSFFSNWRLCLHKFCFFLRFLVGFFNDLCFFQIYKNCFFFSFSGRF